MAQGAPDFIPPINPSRCEFYFDDMALKFRNDQTGTLQTRRQWGKWKARMEWDGWDVPDLNAIVAFISRKGTWEVFTAYDVTRPLPRGNVAAGSLNGTVNNAYATSQGAAVPQVGRTLYTAGWPNSQLLFRVGDLIGLQNTQQMFMVSADCSSNGSGQAAIQLCQYITASPANGEAVVVSFVPCRMVVTSSPRPEVYDWQTMSYAIELEEP